MKPTQRQHKVLSKLTPFQRSVLLQCAKIPKGQTRTYGQIAKAIGKPRASRAVGSALSINPLAPLIPCHRVIRSDGEMGGYSANGGVKKKKKLIEKERAVLICHSFIRA